MAKSSFINKIFNAGPLILLYYLCISEVDTNLEKMFEIFTLNFQIILIYFWVIKRPDIMANGHVFLAGLINDVVMGFPLGISSLSYLIIIFVGTYVRNKSVNTQNSLRLVHILYGYDFFEHTFLFTIKQFF